MKFRIKTLISCLLVAFSTQSSWADECEHFLIYKNSNIHVWDTVTPRSFKKVFTALEDANSPMTLKGVHGPILPFDVISILDGRRSLLSLGEGESDFVFKLLEIAKGENRDVDIHAVDMIYRDTTMFIENGLGTEEDALRFVTEFPNNYHGHYFQSMKLTDSKGELKQFDEIVSSNSLTFLLGRRPKKESFQEIMDRDLAMMRNILAHLKKGGNLRIWPVARPMQVTEGSPQSYITLLVRRLVQEGQIRNHNYVYRAMPGTFGALVLTK